MLAQRPKDGNALNLLGVAARQQGDLPTALRLSARAVSINPQSPVFLANRGATLAESGALAEAVAVLHQALALRPDDVVTLRNLGQLLCARGEAAAALPPLRRAVALAPKAPEPLLALAHALREAGVGSPAVGKPDPGAGIDHPGGSIGPAAFPTAGVSATPTAASANAGRFAAGAPKLPATQVAASSTAKVFAANADQSSIAPHAAELPDTPVSAARAALAAAEALGPGARTLADQARFLLAALGEAATPDRAPADYVRDLFDQYAPRFDAELTEKLGYRTPAALAALLLDTGMAADRSRQVLDLGCGTGLSGLALAPFATRMEGVDLSPRMLAAAARRGCYAALHEADLLAFLPAHPARFGLIAAADVLNYLGDLGPALVAMRYALAPGGAIAFSIEAASDETTYALGAGMRFRHAPGHVVALAEAAGLRECARQSLTLREERGNPVAGVLFVFEATPGA